MKKTKSFRTKERQRAEGARLQSLVRADGHTRARADKHVDTRSMRQATLVQRMHNMETWRREGDGGGFSQSACRPERRVRSEEEFDRESSQSVSQFIMN